MCRRHSPDMCRPLFSKRIWVENFDDMILFMSTPFEIRAQNLKISSSVHSPLIAPKPIWNTTLIMLEDIPTFTTRTTTILLCGGGGSKAGKWVLSRAEDGGYNQHTTAAPASSVVCSLWGSSSSSSHRPSPLRTILYTFHKSNFDRVFSIVYYK